MYFTKATWRTPWDWAESCQPHVFHAHIDRAVGCVSPLFFRRYVASRHALCCIIHLGHGRTDGRGVVKALELLDLVVVVQLRQITPDHTTPTQRSPKAATDKRTKKPEKSKATGATCKKLGTGKQTSHHRHSLLPESSRLGCSYRVLTVQMCNSASTPFWYI